jgi:hypothetical protein
MRTAPATQIGVKSSSTSSSDFPSAVESSTPPRTNALNAVLLPAEELSVVEEGPSKAGLLIPRSSMNRKNA